MVVNPSKKIAVKCSTCGKYNTFNMDIFKMKVQTNIVCSCGNRILSMKTINGELILDIECIACEKTHSYRFKIKDIVSEKPLTILSCPYTGMEIAFIGKDNYVDDIMERYMGDMFELLKYLGVVENRTTNLIK